MKFKRLDFVSLVCVGVFMLFIIPTCFTLAQSSEEIKLITYYPAPFGDYKEMRVDQLSVGEDYRN